MRKNASMGEDRHHHFRRFLFTGIVSLFLFLSPAVHAKTAPQSGGYLSVPHLAASLGMKAVRSGSDKSIHYELTSKWTSIKMEEGKRVCTVNGVQMMLSTPLRAKDGILYISRIDYAKSLKPLLLPQTCTPVPEIRRIVLDPGHGGKDNGAENKHLKLREKDLTLSTAFLLKKELEKRGYTVLMTRETDTFIDLDKRPQKAHALHADLFISLHYNASTDPAVNGAETHILPPDGQVSTSGNIGSWGELSGNDHDEWNVIAAYYVQRELVNTLGEQDRGVRRSRFAVLRTLKCPGMLVESGFISNTQEGRKISGEAYRQRIAAAIARAVDAYARTIKKAAEKNKAAAK